MNTFWLGVLVLGFGTAVTFATSLFSKVDWSAKLKNMIAVVLSVVGGSLAVVAENDWSLENFASVDLLALVTVVYGLSQAVYQFITRGTPLDNRLKEFGSE